MPKINILLSSKIQLARKVGRRRYIQDARNNIPQPLLHGPREKPDANQPGNFGRYSTIRYTPLFSATFSVYFMLTHRLSYNRSMSTLLSGQSSRFKGLPASALGQNQTEQYYVQVLRTQ